MTYFLSAFFFPIAALAVLFGLGLLVAAAGGNKLRPELVAPVGLGAVVLLGQFTAWAGVGTPANVIIMLALALVGYVLLAHGRGSFWADGGEPRAWGWWIASGLLAGGLVLSTIIFFGRESLSGFLLDTTSVVQMYGGDFALQGSDNFRDIKPSDSGSALNFSYFGLTFYPYGSQVALALLGSITGLSLIWLYTPFMAVMVSLTGFALFRVARLFELSRGWASVAAFVGAAPALVYGNALQGSIKEIVAIPLIVILGLLLMDPLLRSTPRSLAVTGAVCAAATFGAIGVAAFAWLLPLGLLALLAQSKRFGGDWGLGKSLRAIGLASAALIVAMIPMLGGLRDAITLARALSQSTASLAADPGNLLGPIHKAQAFGVWIGNSHRQAPDLQEPTLALLVVVGIAFGCGLLVTVRQRMWSRAAWIAVMVLVWYVLTWRGTIWLDSKLVAISSHMVMVVSIVGAAWLSRTIASLGWATGKPWERYWQRGASYGLGTIIVLAVLASNGAQYLGTGMLPADRYNELDALNSEFAGQGQAFMPDFDENALFVVRDIGGSGPGNAYANPAFVGYRDGTPVGYGRSADLDKIINRGYDQFRLVIQRRSPQRSRPGADFDLVHRGDSYDVFRRNNVTVVEHLPVGNAAATGYPRCVDVRKLANRAKNDSSLKLVAASPGADTFLVGLRNLTFTGPLAGEAPTGAVSGSGSIAFDANVFPGQQLWWLGTVSRSLKVLVDGRQIDTLMYSLGGDGNVSGPVPLPTGQHKITLVRGGASLAPGAYLGSALGGLFLAPAGTAKPAEVDPDRAPEKLCGHQVDWIELVRRK
ncbi:MAG: hypothetical protein JHD02_01720 [Thermoleophilaceae bacterium]|nr:hypothetical protein [Thermoleophilaceae bacterium]